MSLQLIILGSGTSHGVPMIGCRCAVCTSDDPRDKRTRSSAAFRTDGRTILIDTSPELRLQCIATGVDHVDAILYTHHHADHVVGLDDVRVFCERSGGELPVYGSERTLDRVQRMFPYAFQDTPNYPSSKPRLTIDEIAGPFELFGRTVTPIPLMHGPLPIFGFRLGRIAYCTDVSFIPEESFDLLHDLDVLVLDGLRHKPHPTHFTIEQAVEHAKRIGARRTYFTHIAHALPHAATNTDLPDGMELAYDGLVCESAD